METRSKEQIDLENIANLIKTNKYNELKTRLEQQETRLTGQC